MHAEVRACASLFNLELLHIACSTFLKLNLGDLSLLGSRDTVCVWSSWAEVAAFRKCSIHEMFHWMIGYRLLYLRRKRQKEEEKKEEATQFQAFTGKSYSLRD